MREISALLVLATVWTMYMIGAVAIVCALLKLAHITWLLVILPMISWVPQ